MSALLNFFKAYTQGKMWVILALGFSSGLPLLLVGATLGAWLTDSGLDRASVGMFALVALPYSFNFLWAPFIDRLSIPYLTRRMGRRRSWILCTQLLLLLSIASLSQFNPAQHVELIAWLSVLVAWFSASQDVVIDAYRAEYLKTEEYGEGAAVAVFGYRLGMLMAGAGALALADHIDWPTVFLAMAAAMMVGIITILLASEPVVTREAEPDQPLRRRAIIARALKEPFMDFAARHAKWVLILLLVLTYRLPDGFIGFMTTPFFLDIGFSKSEVAAVAKLYGFGATLIGMFVGGSLIHRFGIPRCLLYFLLVQVLANLSYLLLSEMGPQTIYLITAISFDNLSGGMITAAAIAYMMSLCNLQFTATQYALLSSLASFASKSLAGAAGFVSEAHGWSAMFALSALMGLPAFIIWILLFSRKRAGLS